MNLIGYPAELIYRPGDCARFMVSAEGNVTFDAQIVRVICGDATEGGPGFKEEAVPGVAQQGIAGKKQVTEVGSYFRVPGHPSMEAAEVGFIFNIFATTPTKGPQILVARWESGRKQGFRLLLTKKGILRLETGDGTGQISSLELKEPIGARQWLGVAVGLNQTTGQARLHVQKVAAYFTKATALAEEGKVSYRAASSLETPLIFAAQQQIRDGHKETCDFYNGRIESPVMVGRMPSPADVTTYQTQDPSAVGVLLAHWDFSQNFASDKVADTGPARIDGRLVNLPARGVTGSLWDGSEQNFAHKPAHYRAVHFHDDDLEDCHWTESFSVDLPGDLASGIYAAKLSAGDDEHHVVFLVEERPGSRRSDIAFLAASVTYVAYSNEHYDFDEPNMEMKNGYVTTLYPSDLYMNEHRELGLSTYDRHSDGHGIFYSSARRPLFSMHIKDKIWALAADTHIIDWLEAEKFKYDVITDHAVHHQGVDRLSAYKVVVTGTHPEYWTTPMWRAMTAYLAGGGRLMYLGGNGFYWRIAVHPEKPWLVELRRAESGARYWDSEPGEAHMNFTGEYGGLWRRAANPPQSLVGIGTVATGFDYSSYYRRRPESNNPRASFAFAGVEDDIIGNFGSIGGGACGSEIDRADPWLGSPANLLILARSEGHTRQYNVVPEETPFHHPTVNGEEAERCFADMVFFETGRGGAVFSTGSISWAASLAYQGYDNNVAKITGNVLRRFADPKPFPEPDHLPGSEEMLRTRTDAGHEFYLGIDRNP